MLFLVHLCQHFVYWKKWETKLCSKKNFPERVRGGGGGTLVNFCWVCAATSSPGHFTKAREKRPGDKVVCAAGLPEPLPHYSLFWGQIIFIDPILVTFGKM